jgi:hypothetical protein
MKPLIELTLERKNQPNNTLFGRVVIVAPLVEPDYWLYRVRLSSTQAVVGFPKFSTIGIGFAKEVDWNTNLPYTCETEEIYEHIKHNAGRSTGATKERCLLAIKMIQDALNASKEQDIP